jgi:hypothetical protein
MANYNSNLIDWGSSGTAYPAGYSYLAGDQPEDGYDNYFNYHTVADIKHLVELTNARLESSKGATLPVSAEEGELFYDSDGYTFHQYRNGSWVEIASGGDFAAHAADTSNPHSVTAAQVGALEDSAGSVTEANLAFDPATQAELDAHTGDTTNPHSVTAADVAALPTAGGTMTGNIDFGQNEACKMVIEVRTSDPSTPVTGQVWFRSDSSQMKFYDGSNVQTITSA